MKPEPRTSLHVTRLILICVLGLCARAQAYEVVDDRGEHVQWSQPPQRVVSLLPSLTESVCALGFCDRLVGVDDFSNFPASVKRLPHLGGLDDTRVEDIVALHPDVVLLAKSARVTQRLKNLGVRVLVLEPERYQDMQRVLLRVGELFQIPPDQGAMALWQSIQNEVGLVARSIPPSAAHVRVYYEVSRAPYAAGESSFIGETLLRLGVQNIVPPELGPFPKLNPEFVVKANPQVIMVSQSESQDLEQRPGWSRIDAVMNHRICRFTATQIDVLSRPGPRMAEAAHIMARCLSEVAR